MKNDTRETEIQAAIRAGHDAWIAEAARGKRFSPYAALSAALGAAISALNTTGDAELDEWKHWCRDHNRRANQLSRTLDDRIADLNTATARATAAEERAGRLAEFHEAWVADQVASATGHPDTARAAHNALIAIHHHIRIALGSNSGKGEA